MTICERTVVFETQTPDVKEKSQSKVDDEKGRITIAVRIDRESSAKPLEQ